MTYNVLVGRLTLLNQSISSGRNGGEK